MTFYDSARDNIMREIPLTQGKAALVDDEDYEWLNQYRWCAHKNRNTFYAARRDSSLGRGVIVKMHRSILGAERGQLVDHRDGNGLNNTRDNLRLCTRSENQRNQRIRKDNSTGFRGVSRRKNKRKFRAGIRVNNRDLHLGNFDCPIEAGKAYDAAALLLHGKFANTNNLLEK